LKHLKKQQFRLRKKNYKLMNQLKKLISKYLQRKRHVKKKKKNRFGKRKKKKFMKRLVKKHLKKTKIKLQVNLKKNKLVVNNKGKNKINKKMLKRQRVQLENL